MMRLVEAFRMLVQSFCAWLHDWPSGAWGQGPVAQGANETLDQEATMVLGNGGRGMMTECLFIRPEQTRETW